MCHDPSISKGRIAVSTGWSKAELPGSSWKHVIKLLPGRNWEMGVCTCCFCTEPWGNSCKQVFTCLLRTPSFFAYSCGTCEYKSCWLSELCDLGAHPLGGSLKSWGTRCGSVTPQGEAGSWRFPTDWMLLHCYTAVDSWHCARVGFMARVCLSLSSPFSCGYFFSHLMGRSHSISFCISLRRNCSVCTCIFRMFMGGRNFRGLLFCHHGPNSHQSAPAPHGVFYHYISLNFH